MILLSFLPRLQDTYRNMVHICARRVAKLTLVPVPTPEELETIAGFPDDKTKLGKTEQYFWEVRDIHRLGTRLTCFKFKQTFDDQIREIKPVWDFPSLIEL